jgi:hypothetical protein
MRIFMMLVAAAMLVAVGYEAGHAFFARSHSVSSAAPASSTLAPHEIHLNYRAMEKLPVHDVKDAI